MVRQGCVQSTCRTTTSKRSVDFPRPTSSRQTAWVVAGSPVGTSQTRSRPVLEAVRCIVNRSMRARIRREPAALRRCRRATSRTCMGPCRGKRRGTVGPAARWVAAAVGWAPAAGAAAPEGNANDRGPTSRLGRARVAAAARAVCSPRRSRARAGGRRATKAVAWSLGAPAATTPRMVLAACGQLARAGLPSLVRVKQSASHKPTLRRTHTIKWTFHVVQGMFLSCLSRALT